MFSTFQHYQLVVKDTFVSRFTACHIHFSSTLESSDQKTSIFTELAHINITLITTAYNEAP